MDFGENVSLVVSSSDKYEDAWYPYFELLKKYWPQHPARIYLITETRSFVSEGLDIQVCNFPETDTWSERLYKTLARVPTKYIVFSLEDFFLLDYVKQNRVEECLSWMEADTDIAVCRLFASDNPGLKPTDQYQDFYVADCTIGFRLDTQAALWNKETLMSFIDLTEDPWAFESNGTKRIMNTEKKFLWHYSPDLYPLEDKIFPYRIFQRFGYGIAWGHWLWNNKKHFLRNGIENVRYHRLGILSKTVVNLRFKHLYTQTPSALDKAIRPFWRMIIQWKKVRSNLLVFGLEKGLKRSWHHMR